MLIERYSDNGFKPMKQLHHLKSIEIYLKEYNEGEYLKSNKVPSSMAGVADLLLANYRSSYAKNAKFIQDNYEDFKEGVWVFAVGEADAFFLNHLDKIPKCHTAEIDDSAIAYTHDFARKGKICDLLEEYAEVFVPKSSLDSLLVLS